MSLFIHHSAEVSPAAVLGAGSKVWVNAQIREYATIGDDCIISKDVYIDKNVKIGSRCKIQNAAQIFDGVTIGDDVFVGPGVVFTNDLVPRASNPSWNITSTSVSQNASIGANATIICGVHIGAYAMIAAGSVVTKNVRAFELVAGNPARHLGWVDEFGNRKQASE